MSFSIVAAIASNNVIGKNNKLPWHIPEDLEHFYKLVSDKPIIMGRKTYESIGKPIKNSQNTVLSNNTSLKLDDCKIVSSITNILDLYPHNTEVMIIGGESIYQQFLPLINKMYLTFIDHQFDGDAYFPKWRSNEWQVTDECVVLTTLYPCRFVNLQRK